MFGILFNVHSYVPSLRDEIEMEGQHMQRQNRRELCEAREAFCVDFHSLYRFGHSPPCDLRRRRRCGSRGSRVHVVLVDDGRRRARRGRGDGRARGNSLFLLVFLRKNLFLLLKTTGSGCLNTWGRGTKR